MATAPDSTNENRKRSHSQMASQNPLIDEPPSKRARLNPREEKKTAESKIVTPHEISTNKIKECFTQTEKNRFKKQQRKLRRQSKKHEEQQQRQKVLDAMSEEERKEFMEKERIKKERQREERASKEKEQLKRILHGKDHGLRIVFDLHFPQLLAEERDYYKVVRQLSFSWNSNKLATYPASFHIVNYHKKWEKGFKQQGADKWHAHIHEKDLLDVFEAEEIVYLSPDAKEVLQRFDASKAYVIGGIVDRTVVKNLTLDRARELGVRSVKLPLDGIGLEGRQEMNIDVIVKMLLALQEWKEGDAIIDFIKPHIPKRKFVKGTKPSKRKKVPKDEDCPPVN